MKIHSWPNNWKFVPEDVRRPLDIEDGLFKNNPDVQWDMCLNGFWIRPNTPLHTYLILKGALVNIHLDEDRTHD